VTYANEHAAWLSMGFLDLVKQPAPVTGCELQEDAGVLLESRTPMVPPMK